MGFKSLNVNDYHGDKYGCMISFNENLGKKEKHFTEIKIDFVKSLINV